jgi:molybdate-binding protein/DNA-binding transcriptional regulator YhcF (GntR family)
MDETHLYQKIVESIRQDMFMGVLKPGDSLPPVREMARKWDCTTGTILRAYHELAHQSLLVSHIGRGTKVAEKLPAQNQVPLRRAMLMNRIEAYLLEIMTSGYTPEEVEQATRLALDRWRAYNNQPPEAPAEKLRFIGSHDPAVTLIASQFTSIFPGVILQLSFTGSLGGLIALVEGEADIAGCHLWDEESDTYNIPFVRRLLPGRKVALLTLAHRRVGLIVPSENPLAIKDLKDLSRSGLRFVNRQPGSGTRVWLDAQLKRLDIDSREIQGYQDEKMTHSEVASAVTTGHADLGLGIQTAALSYGQDFVLLTTERYDLAVPAETWDCQPVQALRKWLMTAQARSDINNLGGYDTAQTGQVQWVG